MSPPESVQFVTLGRADGMSFIFTFVPLSPQVSCPVSRPGRHCTHSYDSCVIARKLTLRKKKPNLLKELLVNLSIHPYRERDNIFIILIRKQIYLLTQREVLFLSSWTISKDRRKLASLSWRINKPSPCLEKICKSPWTKLSMLFAQKTSRYARIISQHYLLICFALVTQKLAWVLGQLRLVFLHWLQKVNLSI